FQYHHGIEFRRRNRSPANRAEPKHRGNGRDGSGNGREIVVLAKILWTAAASEARRRFSCDFRTPQTIEKRRRALLAAALQNHAATQPYTTRIWTASTICSPTRIEPMTTTVLPAISRPRSISFFSAAS